MSPHHCVQYPPNTSASDWEPFWASTRETVFDLLLGLKDCFPRELTGPAAEGPMTGIQWSAWVHDVLWTLHQLIRM